MEGLNIADMAKEVNEAAEKDAKQPQEDKAGDENYNHEDVKTMVGEVLKTQDDQGEEQEEKEENETQQEEEDGNEPEPKTSKAKKEAAWWNKNDVDDEPDYANLLKEKYGIDELNPEKAYSKISEYEQKSVPQKNELLENPVVKKVMEYVSTGKDIKDIVKLFDNTDYTSVKEALKTPETDESQEIFKNLFSQKLKDEGFSGENLEKELDSFDAMTNRQQLREINSILSEKTSEKDKFNKEISDYLENSQNSQKALLDRARKEITELKSQTVGKPFYGDYEITEKDFDNAVKKLETTSQRREDGSINVDSLLKLALLEETIPKIVKTLTAKAIDAKVDGKIESYLDRAKPSKNNNSSGRIGGKKNNEEEELETSYKAMSDKWLRK